MEEKEQSKPIPEESFDGAKHSTTIEFKKCNHELYLVKPQEVRCKKCLVGWSGNGVEVLLKT